ncbi:hypothetical protein ACOME3_005317 [Neoechinorhynchus agilis]
MNISVNRMDIEAQKLFCLVVQHQMFKQMSNGKKDSVHSPSAINSLMESKISEMRRNPKLSRLQKMRLLTIPPPEYFSNLLQPTSNKVDFTSTLSRKRKFKQVKNGFQCDKKKQNIVDVENKENLYSNTTKRKMTTFASVLSSVSHNCEPQTEQRKPKIEHMDLCCFGALHSDRDYRCWKCPKCKRTSLEDIQHQRGQCGYKSCGFIYCTLCFSNYHPFEPCIQPFQPKSSKTALKRQLRRC